jgi:hypothetical protein
MTMKNIMALSALALAALALSAGSGFAQTATSTANGISSSTAGSLSGTSANYQGLSVISTDPANQTVKNVPNIYAPGLAAAGSEVCLGSISAGGAAAGFGLTIGGTYNDRGCQLRLNARTLAVLGYPAAARETMCLDPDVRQAMATAGTPCRADAAYAYKDPPTGAIKGAAATDPRKPKRVAAQPAPATVDAQQPQEAPPAESKNILSAVFRKNSAADAGSTPAQQPDCSKEKSGWYEWCAK